MAQHSPAYDYDRDERIARIEATLQEVEQQSQRFLLLADTLRAQVKELKEGSVQPWQKITDWKGFTKDW